MQIRQRSSRSLHACSQWRRGEARKATATTGTGLLFSAEFLASPVDQSTAPLAAPPDDSAGVTTGPPSAGQHGRSVRRSSSARRPRCPGSRRKPRGTLSCVQGSLTAQPFARAPSRGTRCRCGSPASARHRNARIALRPPAAHRRAGCSPGSRVIAANYTLGRCIALMKSSIARRDRTPDGPEYARGFARSSILGRIGNRAS